MDAYFRGPGATIPVPAEGIAGMLRKAAKMVEATVRANRRTDGLYHAYNLLHLGDKTAAVISLPLMLEGQVAALSSCLLTAEEALSLLENLRAGALYREDQHSYLLYPVKDPPTFLAKNRIPDSILNRCPTLAARLDSGDQSVVVRDREGQLRFHPDLHNAGALLTRIEKDFPAEETRAMLEAYEEVFNHRAFTGRSGSMYGYEGIGCIYWHMIAKLLLAVQETCDRSIAEEAPRAVVEALKQRYYDIRAGLGFTKKPDEFGAFPLDPYSHTPPFGGAKQPGMTGQVKEEILTRWGELGIKIEGGKIAFRPWLLPDDEWLTEAAEFNYIDIVGTRQCLSLEAGSLGFTFCQVPIVYVRGDTSRIVIKPRDGDKITMDGDTLDESFSAEIFARTGTIRQITVHIPAN
jgi:hypothetical protein